VQSVFNLVRLELFFVLLGRFPTGSSLSAPDSHEPYLFYHSVPLCTTS